jgi:hypothetical protein
MKKKKAHKATLPKSLKSAKRKSPLSCHSRSSGGRAIHAARRSNSRNKSGTSCFKGLKISLYRKGMKKICHKNPEIKFRSRYGIERLLRRLDEKRASITGESSFTRFVTNSETGAVDFVDFEGGPTIQVNSRIPGVGIVKSVEKCDYSKSDRGKKDSVTVTFKHDGSG